MKLMTLVLISLSVITFRSCGEAVGHDDVDLDIDTVYAGGVMSLTPYVDYEGEEEAVFEYGSQIAWINKIEQDGEILYEYEGDPGNVQQDILLETDGQHDGETVELEVEPGIFDIHMTAHYFFTNDQSESNETVSEYSHEKMQKVEVQGNGSQ
ncbi:hypothetical protein CR194_17930 [Salipaludibacillus keqinensis]|uniref:Uncharacterized protein n=1 Tax=Salipaludibacillus keqinensis TaxID=2045207 RepID=A0A323T884_9BACI|nr:hypothetical protein [Salipaludibacillus keqinensis]PYZ92072.1 hypothetical protein CR194_17930 [Salipaludibacillus keqinensis]